MQKSSYIIALVVGLFFILTIGNAIGDMRASLLTSVAYIACVVYLSKRKPKRRIILDSDIALTLSDYLFNLNPNKGRECHAVFYRRENASVSVCWHGKHLHEKSALNLTATDQSHLSQMFDVLYDYHIQNHIGRWNIAHFYVAPDKKKFNLDVKMNMELEQNIISFQEYVRRFM